VRDASLRVRGPPTTSSIRRDEFVFAQELIASRVRPIFVSASAAVQQQQRLAGAFDLVEKADSVNLDSELFLLVRHVHFLR
jgi:hypothetical protein